MAFGVTDEGFIAKRTADVIDDLVAAINAGFDDGSGVDTSPESVFGQLIGVIGDALGQTWEQLQLAFDQYNPSNARGRNLDSLVQINGLTRKEQTASMVTVTLTGTATSIIPAGTQVATADLSVTFATDEAATIGGGGTVDVTATAIEPGNKPALAGTVTRIVTPQAGLTSVTNATDASAGDDYEEDEALRLRRDASTSNPAQAIVESIFSNLADINGVTFVRVYVNETDSTDSRGLPPHSIAVVIQGGDDTEIAETILDEKPAGIEAFGTTTVAVDDIQGFSYSISFIRPTPVEITVQVDVTALANFPVDGDTQITQAILDYTAGGGGEVGCQFGDQDGFVPGEDVVLSRLYTPVNSIPNHTVTSLQIGAPGLGTSDITIDFDEVADFDSSRITVNVS